MELRQQQQQRGKTSSAPLERGRTGRPRPGGVCAAQAAAVFAVTAATTTITNNSDNNNPGNNSSSQNSSIGISPGFATTDDGDVLVFVKRDVGEAGEAGEEEAGEEDEPGAGLEEDVGADEAEEEAEA